MENLPLISIQILNWNRAEETVRAINSALNQTYNNIEIVVIDNGSVDDSIHKIEQSYPNIRLVKLDKNYGCPGGRNRGIDFCNGEYIFFCDNDGILHKEAVNNAIYQALNDSKIAVVTGTVKEFIDEKEIDPNLKIENDTVQKSTIFQGGVCLIKKSTFSNISKYPDDYFYGAEETYLSLKILDAKQFIMKSNNVILWHKKSENARNLENESLHLFRNTLANAYQLYPLFFCVIYFFYFLIFYGFYAFKYGFLYKFLKQMPSYFKNTFKYKRTPVEYSTFIEFQKNKRKNV